MLKAFFGSRFSPNMTRTPEGYLICHNVPLARTGVQRYLQSEVNQAGGEDVVNVYRNENEVFSEATLASFEGKPVTDNHPSEFLQPANAMAYARGVCQNVRRGTGDESDLIIGDLVIYDAMLIGEIEAGKREISAGYYCDYEPFEDGLEQKNIICNHVAVVHNGRAGSRVAIKDSESVVKKIGGKKIMAKRTKESIWTRMFHSFAKDEDITPEELKEAADAVNEAEEKACDEEKKDEEEKKEDMATDEEVREAVADALAPLIRRMDAFERALQMRDEEPDDVDALEKDLTEDASDGDEEASATVAPEDIKTEDEDEEDATETSDRAMAIRMFKAIKPTLCALPPTERKKATDSLRKALLPVKKGSNSNVYGKLLARKQTADAASKGLGDFGEACRKFNPHLNK